MEDATEEAKERLVLASRPTRSIYIIVLTDVKAEAILQKSRSAAESHHRELARFSGFPYIRIKIACLSFFACPRSSLMVKFNLNKLRQRVEIAVYISRANQNLVGHHYRDS